MADQKISQLTGGGAAQATDEFVVARSGGNNKITGANVAAAATSVGTLSSLTVSGDLTVDTSTLKVDSTNNFVGVTAPTPRGPLHVGADLNNGATDAAAINLKQTSTTASTGIYLERSGERKGYYLYIGGDQDSLIFQRNNAGTKADAMSLTRDGNLGLGVTPSYQFDLLTPTSATDRQAVRINYGTTVGRAVYFGIDAAVTGTTYIQSATPSSVSSGTDLALNPKGGNVGVGTDSPAVRLHLKGANNEILRLQSSDATTGSLYFAYYDSADSEKAYIGYGSGATDEFSFVQRENAAMVFFTNATERARITSGGYFKASYNGTYVGSTGDYHELVGEGTTPGVVTIIRGNGTSTNGTYDIIDARNGNATGRFIVRDSGNAINTNGSYGTISDIKHKQDVIDAPSQWDDLKAVRFRKFRMKAEVEANPDAPYMLGVVAQELQATSPGLIEANRDVEQVEVTDEDGNVATEMRPTGTETLSVKSSILLMKAAVALQEAMARIEALEARLEALEA